MSEQKTIIGKVIAVTGLVEMPCPRCGELMHRTRRIDLVDGVVPPEAKVEAPEEPEVCNACTRQDRNRENRIRRQQDAAKRWRKKGLVPKLVK